MTGFAFHPIPHRDDEPATIAWLSLGGIMPHSVDELLGPAGKQWNKSAIFRLNGAGINGAPVIAKGSQRPTISIEKEIYQSVLPSVGLSTLHFYGFAGSRPEKRSWLFLEAANGTSFRAESLPHRIMAAHWLAMLHTKTSLQEFSSKIPTWDVADYLLDASFAKRKIDIGCGNRSVPRHQIAILRSLFTHCDWLENRCNRIIDLCARFPRCLVHGDFDHKNVRISTDDHRPLLQIMDWETACYSCPHIDLPAVDLTTYYEDITATWPNIRLHDLRDMAAIGSLMFNIGVVAAISNELSESWAIYRIDELSYYESIIAEAIRSLDWA